MSDVPGKHFQPIAPTEIPNAKATVERVAKQFTANPTGDGCAAASQLALEAGLYAARVKDAQKTKQYVDLVAKELRDKKLLPIVEIANSKLEQEELDYVKKSSANDKKVQNLIEKHKNPGIKILESTLPTPPETVVKPKDYGDVLNALKEKYFAKQNDGSSIPSEVKRRPSAELNRSIQDNSAYHWSKKPFTSPAPADQTSKTTPQPDTHNNQPLKTPPQTDTPADQNSKTTPQTDTPPDQTSKTTPQTDTPPDQTSKTTPPTDTPTDQTSKTTPQTDTPPDQTSKTTPQTDTPPDQTSKTTPQTDTPPDQTPENPSNANNDAKRGTKTSKAQDNSDELMPDPPEDSEHDNSAHSGKPSVKKGTEATSKNQLLSFLSKNASGIEVGLGALAALGVAGLVGRVGGGATAAKAAQVTETVANEVITGNETTELAELEHLPLPTEGHTSNSLTEAEHAVKKENSLLKSPELPKETPSNTEVNEGAHQEAPPHHTSKPKEAPALSSQEHSSLNSPESAKEQPSRTSSSTPVTEGSNPLERMRRAWTKLEESTTQTSANTPTENPTIQTESLRPKQSAIGENPGAAEKPQGTLEKSESMPTEMPTEASSSKPVPEENISQGPLEHSVSTTNEPATEALSTKKNNNNKKTNATVQRIRDFLGLDPI